MAKIKFFEKKTIIPATHHWKGRKNGFLFDIANTGVGYGRYYATVTHAKKDIRFNSLWSKITFKELQDAFDWCDAFESKNFKCLGGDFVYVAREGLHVVRNGALEPDTIIV